MLVQTLCKYKMPPGNMGAWASVEEDPVVKVWTLLLKEWGMECDEQALLALTTWSKNHRLDATEGATLDLRT